MPYYPPTVNDAEAYAFAMDVAGRCEPLSAAAQRRRRAVHSAGRAQLLRSAAALPLDAMDGSARHLPVAVLTCTELQWLGSSTISPSWLPARLPSLSPALPLGRRVVGDAAAVGETEATMAGEDFSFITRAVPSCFLFLGTRNESVGAGACVRAWGMHGSGSSLPTPCLQRVINACRVARTDVLCPHAPCRSAPAVLQCMACTRPGSP